MADNPNKSSARPTFHGSGAPRRTNIPSEYNTVDLAENDSRRYRNHSFQPTRSNGRNRTERPQTSNNRNVTASNRSRCERPAFVRTANDRLNVGNDCARTFGPSSTMTREHDYGMIQHERLQSVQHHNGTDMYNRENPVSDSMDQETISFPKNNSTSAYLPNFGNGETSRPWVPVPSNSMGSTNNGTNQYNALQNESEQTDLSSQKSQLGGLQAVAESTYKSPLRRPHVPVPMILPNEYVMDPPAYNPGIFYGFPDGPHPALDGPDLFQAPNGTGYNRALPSKPVRPIRGRFSAPPTCGLPRPILTQHQESNRVHNTGARPAQPVHTITSGALHEEWANAPEFVPKGSKPKSYAEVLNPKPRQGNSENKKVCPSFERTGECRSSASSCPYLHNDVCELCGINALHPTDMQQRKLHIQYCNERREKESELSFAIARSREKTCGICFEVVVEKQVHERRFGILTQCNHCFCLTCIRKWRQARQFENKVVRACPECRVTSDFVCPSVYWVETKEDKDKLIDNYKNALAEKQCKYFRQGRGSCPFGNKCFYLHAFPDGTKLDVGPPPRRRRARRNRDDVELGDMIQQIILWDFLDEHDHHWLYSFADDIEELVAFFSDSDESEWSDYEFLLD